MKQLFYHISWLEKAIEKFKKSKDIKSIDSEMTIGEFVKKYLDIDSIVIK